MKGKRTSTEYPHVARRAEHAANLFDCYIYDPDYPRDVISDVMHFAAAQGMDPMAEVEQARKHFLAETEPAFAGVINEDGDTVENVELCRGCGKYVPGWDAVWIDPDTREATMTGRPYHPGCAPEQYPEPEEAQA